MLPDEIPVQGGPDSLTEGMKRPSKLNVFWDVLEDKVLGTDIKGMGEVAVEFQASVSQGRGLGEVRRRRSHSVGTTPAQVLALPHSFSPAHLK